MIGAGPGVAKMGLAAVVAGFCALVLVGGSADTSTGPSSTSDAYVEKIRRVFIPGDEEGPYLIVNDVRTVEQGKPIISLRGDLEKTHPELKLYADKSGLVRDLSDPIIWRVENGRVVDIDGSAHRVAAPFQRDLSWRGRLDYRRQPDTAAADVSLQFDGGRLPPIWLTNPEGAPSDGQVAVLDLSHPPAAPIRASRVEIWCGGRKVADLRRVGDQATLTEVDNAGCAVTVRGQPVRNRFAALPIYRSAEFTPRNGAPSYRLVRRASTAVSQALSLPSSSGSRIRDPIGGGWPQAVESDFNRAFQGQYRTQNVVTSLDPTLQRQVQVMLDRAVRSAVVREKVDLIGAVTVMDAMTGEVLAMGSHTPASPTLPSTDINQNFVLLPIGSTAKPLLTAAILAANPQFADLKVPGRIGEIDSVLGLELSKPFHTHESSSAKIVDLDEFIRSSDNYYAASLLLMGNTEAGSRYRVPVSGPNGYYLGSAAQLTRPKSIFEQPGPNGLLEPALFDSRNLPAWTDKLSRLFDVNLRRRGQIYSAPVSGRCGDGATRFGDDFFDASPWRGLQKSGLGLNWCGFREATPTREALALEGATARADFRRDFLTVMLGNGEGRWTTIKLAEAYARLATGRMVTASFLHTDPHTPERFQPVDPLFADPASRARLTHAMTLVMNGTAAHTRIPAAITALQVELASQGLVLGQFSKTGTPTVPEVATPPVVRGIDGIISKGRLSIVNGRLMLFAAGTQQPVAITDARGRKVSSPDASRALAADPTLAGVLKLAGVSPQSVVRELAQFDGELAQGGKPFRVNAHTGVLVEVSGGQVVLEDRSDAPRGKVFALVVGAYPQGVPLENGRAANGASRPLRAYSVVVNLQFKDLRSENAAADLAADIAKELLAARLAGKA